MVKAAPWRADHTIMEIKRSLRRLYASASDYLEDAWRSSGYPEQPVPDVGQGAHWIRQNAPRAWDQIKAGGSAFRHHVLEQEREVVAAVRLLSTKGIAAVRTAWHKDPEILAALAVLCVYEPQLLAVVAAWEVGVPGIRALAKLAYRRGLDDREWAHLHDVLDAFAPA
jgi:hypothetical protein